MRHNEYWHVHGDKVRHDEYWHVHVDKVSHDEYWHVHVDKVKFLPCIYLKQLHVMYLKHFIVAATSIFLNASSQSDNFLRDLFT